MTREIQVAAVTGQKKGASKSKKGRKIGRNAVKCARYKNQNKRIRNKIRRLETLTKRQPRNEEAKKVLARYATLY